MVQLVPVFNVRRFGLAICSSLLALAVFGFSAIASADQATTSADSSANMDLARSVAVTGREAFNAGEYETALTLFRRAYSLFPAPTVVLYEARSLEKLGMLLEAAEAYARTSEFPMEASAPAQFAEAVAAAREEGRALKSRIPTLTIKLEGVSGNDPGLEVSINGRAIGAAQLGKAQSLNPGTYRIKGSVGAERNDGSEITLEQGKHETVILRLEAPSLVPPVPDQTSEEEQRSSAPSRSLSTWTLVAGGVGIVGIGAGVVTGLMASSKHAEAEAACPQQLCHEDSGGMSLVEDFQSLRTLSTVSYSVGLAGAATAVVLWLTDSAPSEPSTAQAIRPFWDGHLGGVRGRF